MDSLGYLSFLSLAFVFLTAVGKMRRVFITVAVVTPLVTILGLLLNPLYDHSFFINQAGDALRRGQLLSNLGYNLTPYVNILAIVTGLFGADLGYRITNVALICVIVLLIARDGDKTKSAIGLKWGILWVVISLTLLPTFSAIAVSANKDLTVAIAALSGIIGIMFFGERLAMRQSITTFDSLKQIGLILSGMAITWVQRPYFAKFLVAFCLFGVTLGLVCRLRLSKEITFLLALIGAVLVAAATLFIFESSIKVIESVYLGRATVWSLYGVKVENVYEAIRVAIVALFEGSVSLLFPSQKNESMGTPQLFLGIFDQLVVLAFCGYLLIAKKYSKFIKAFMVAVITYHCIVQIFGSPNYGAFLRLRFGMYACLLAAITRSGGLKNSSGNDCFLATSEKARGERISQMTKVLRAIFKTRKIIVQ